jgi:hypothetical protein
VPERGGCSKRTLRGVLRRMAGAFFGESPPRLWSPHLLQSACHWRKTLPEARMGENPEETEPPRRFRRRALTVARQRPLTRGERPERLERFKVEPSVQWTRWRLRLLFCRLPLPIRHGFCTFARRNPTLSSLFSLIPGKICGEARTRAADE